MKQHFFKSLKIVYRVHIMELKSAKKMRLCRIKQESHQESADEEPKPSIDLSKFKIEIKSEKKLQPVLKRNRQHLEVQYDNISADLSPSSSVEKKNVISELKSETNNWEEVIKNLREMRKDADAPVDSMGCDNCHDEKATPEDQRYQKLISLMLSSQTKDQVNHAAMTKLKEHGCSLNNIINTSDETLGQLIYPVSFWKTKVKHIKKSSEIIRDTYNGDIPKTAEDLCKLPGVGPKMAHLCMNSAWGQITGIGVDTHVHRISNRLGWVKTKTPENTRLALEKWLPRELWKEINHLLVGFGQTICRPVKPRCAECLNNKLCQFGIKEMKQKNKKK